MSNTSQKFEANANSQHTDWVSNLEVYCRICHTVKPHASVTCMPNLFASVSM